MKASRNRKTVLFSLKTHFLICVWVGVQVGVARVPGHACGDGTTTWESLFFSCGSCGSNSGCRVWQVPLPTCPTAAFWSVKRATSICCFVDVVCLLTCFVFRTGSCPRPSSLPWNPGWSCLLSFPASACWGITKWSCHAWLVCIHSLGETGLF